IRKIKIGKEGERKQNIAKKTVTLVIEVDKISFHKYSSNLRVSGVIKQGPEDITRGKHHTFDIDDNTTITLIKKKWLKFQQDKLKEASQEKVASILICVLDREEAYFALLKKQGYKLLSHIKGKVQKKQDNEKVKSTFYGDVIKILEEYVEKYKIEQIILASTSFWKEEIMKDIKEEDLRKKIILATCSSVDKTAINEVLKRPELREALKKDRISRELKLVEELLGEISKNGAASYGIKEVKKTVESGAVKVLMITDSFINKQREKNKYEEVDQLLNLVESMKGSIAIISSDNDAGKKLDGLGGVGALLRYKLNY
ncbi:MAG: mRNA surveillance protein pelota, partial [Actinomycetia bacterium]|nr:mRNA surveillance protein pelota [Actinomycetes bacterium]